MTLQQLRYAIAVADNRSINKAAKDYYLSQPALSGALHELEKELSMTLFTRTNRGAEPTPEGAEFLAYARQLLDEADLIEDRFIRGKAREKFSVSTQHYTFAVRSFMDLIRSEGTELYDFAISETRTADVLMDVKTLKSELGILYLDSFNREILLRRMKEDQLVFSPLFSCHVYVYLSAGHPLAKKKRVKAGDLAPYTFLTFDQGANSLLYYSEEVHTDTTSDRIIRVNDRATMLNMMIGINGYTLCSGIICEDLNGDHYRAVPLDTKELMTIGVVQRAHAAPSKLAQRYVEILKDYENMVL
ncbi:MAG: LysR family transcriptional regulator [Lachnospiraceae bacterium]|nr:LysR family transcriptional regulator [Lachnospiraceae bacterium]